MLTAPLDVHARILRVIVTVTNGDVRDWLLADLHSIASIHAMSTSACEWIVAQINRTNMFAAIHIDDLLVMYDERANTTTYDTSKLTFTVFPTRDAAIAAAAILSCR